MDVSRWVTVTYISIAILAFVIFDKTFKWIWQATEALTEIAIVGSHITLTTFIAVAATAGLVSWLYRKKEYYAYISEVVIELKKVTWPSISETKRATLIVIVFSILLSLYLWGMDQVWKRVTDFILSAGV
jgi:preprotein translocase subunit SecE